MKKIMFASAVAMACFAISCNDKGSSAGTNDTFTAAKAANDKIYKAMETGDVTGLKDVIAADAVDHNSNMDGSDIKGADSIIAMFTKMHQCFEPGAKYTITSQAMNGDMLYTMLDFAGKTTANPGYGMPPSMQMNMTSVDVVKMKDGKATDHWGFMSMKDVNAMMMMAMPHPGGPAPDGQMHPAGPDGHRPPPPADTMKK